MTDIYSKTVRRKTRRFKKTLIRKLTKTKYVREHAK